MVIRTHTEHSTPVYCYCDTNCFIASQQYYCSLHPLVEMLLYHNVSTGNLDLQGAILITWWATFMLKVWEMITLRPKPILPIKPILKVKTWILCEHAHTFDLQLMLRLRDPYGMETSQAQQNLKQRLCMILALKPHMTLLNLAGNV